MAAITARSNKKRTMKKTLSFGLDQVNVSFLESHCRVGTKTLPLVVTPRWDDSLEFLCKFLELNRIWINEQILRHGAVLIRGFRVNDAVDFERAVSTVQPNLCDAYRGTSPRSLLSGTKYVFSAADVPVNYPIAQHLEMSFLNAPPRNLYFGCLKASQAAGGETALCDFRKVYKDIPTELRDRLSQDKIKYTRTHYRVGEKFTYDVGAMLGWPELFGTADFCKVEQVCQEEGAPAPQWRGPNKDTFHQEWVDEPFQVHPDTKEPVWFNHSQVFHWTTFPSELWYAFIRVKDIKLLLHCILVSVFSFIKYGLLGYKMNLNTTYGDGKPITRQDMGQIRKAIHKNMVFTRWQKGDIMCLDNFSTSHGRQPTYDKGRMICVAWSHPQDKTKAECIQRGQNGSSSLLNVSPFEANDCSGIIDENDDTMSPDLVDVTPDVSPHTSLTGREALDLSRMVHAALLQKAPAGLGPTVGSHTNSKFGHHKRFESCPNLSADTTSIFWLKKNH